MDKLQEISNLAREMQENGDRLFNQNTKKYSTILRKQCQQMKTLCQDLRGISQIYMKNIQSGRKSKSDENAETMPIPDIEDFDLE